VTAISLLAFLIVRRQRAVAIALALYTISNAEPGPNIRKGAEFLTLYGIREPVPTG
jgi:hypothetical protein